jgi:hypothetical protein
MSNKFSKHKWWIVTALLTLPLIVVAAVPNTFMPNTTISSAAVNANFTALDARIAALEAATAKTSASMVLNNAVGGLGATGKTQAFTATGLNPLLVIVSGSAFAGVGGTIDVAVQFDGVVIGHLTTFTNEANSHKAFPTRAFPVATPTPGSHTIGLLHGNAGTTSNSDDYFSVTVVEMH